MIRYISSKKPAKKKVEPTMEVKDDEDDILSYSNILIFNPLTSQVKGKREMFD